MKLRITILFLFFACAIKAQTTLHLKAGIDSNVFQKKITVTGPGGTFINNVLNLTGGGGGGGSVTGVSISTSNGFGGTSSGGATPIITLTTPITGILKGNGTAISAATAGTDYLTPTGSAAGLTSFPTFNQNTTGNAATVTNGVYTNATNTITGNIFMSGTTNRFRLPTLNTTQQNALTSPTFGDMIVNSDSLVGGNTGLVVFNGTAWLKQTNRASVTAIGTSGPATFDPTTNTLNIPQYAGGGTWGSITGTLSSQTDLNTALGLKSPLASPTFTGIPAAPTAAGGTNTTQIATTAFVATAVSTGGTLSSANFVYNEVPAGAVNGSNTVFTLAFTPVIGKVVLFQNGSFLKPTTYWSISGNTITFVTAPATGAEILSNYIK